MTHDMSNRVLMPSLGAEVLFAQTMDHFNDGKGWLSFPPSLIFLTKTIETIACSGFHHGYKHLTDHSCTIGLTDFSSFHGIVGIVVLQQVRSLEPIWAAF